MRVEAKNNTMPHSDLIFIEDNTDYTMWSEKNLPIPEKADGVLANFAVLNCISSIESFFEKISLIIGKHGCLVITIIDPRLGAMVKNYSLIAVARLFISGRLRILNQYHGVYHSTFIHSVNSLKRASVKYFNLNSYVPLKESSFTVLIFERK